jgi:hypothetical protein
MTAFIVSTMCLAAMSLFYLAALHQHAIYQFLGNASVNRHGQRLPLIEL